MPYNLTSIFGTIVIILLLTIIYLLWNTLNYIKQIIGLDKKMVRRIKGLPKEFRPLRRK